MKKVAFLLSAGKGERLRGRETKTPKAFVKIRNKCLLLWSLDKLLKFSDYVVVAVPPGFVKKAENLISTDKEKIFVVEGGKTRQESLLNCFSFFDTMGLKADIIVEHDAARPFFSQQLLKNVISTAEKYGACIPVIDVFDTARIVKKANFVTDVDRRYLKLVQTPQGFKYEIFKKCATLHISGTDGASLLLKSNVKVKIIQGERMNIKITNKEDLKIAKIISMSF